ncbi:MAG: hypothetical protein BWZ09_02317 [Alphaproteobacteria bacterium ADurb.BinA305]|nr:MAG: hypothetical protein BWZ09_02317 [Alphaproteobacteria bacterium ADurb.BinA305]
MNTSKTSSATFAQKYPAYMDPETAKRTIELGRALRAQLQRRRQSVTITVDATRLQAALRRAQHSTSGSAA